MNGFFFDENLPAKILFTSSLPIIHVSVLGRSPRDTEIWQYAKDKKLVIGYCYEIGIPDKGSYLLRSSALLLSII